MYVMYGTDSFLLDFSITMIATVTKSSIVEYVAIRHFFSIGKPHDWALYLYY